MRSPITVCGLAIGVLAMAVAFQFASTKRPHTVEAVDVDVRRLVVELGTVAPQSLTTRTVTLKNDTSIIWNATLVESDCSCVVHAIEPERIEPGGTGILTMEYKAPKLGGAIDRKILVQFHEREAPQFVIDIEGVVQPWCDATPRQLDFGGILAGQAEEQPIRRVVLKLAPGEQIDTEQAPQAPDWLEVKFVEGDMGHSGSSETGTNVVFEMTPLFAPATPAGAFVGDITFTSAANPANSLSLPVRAEVESSLLSVPTNLFLGTRQVGEEFTEHILLHGRSLPNRIDSLFIHERIKVTHGLDDGLITEVIPGEKPGEIDIRCHFKMPDSACFVAANIVVSYQGGNAVTIPVTAKVILPDN